MTEEKKGKEKEKVETAVLSITAKAKARQRAKKIKKEEGQIFIFTSWKSLKYLKFLYDTKGISNYSIDIFTLSYF